MTLRVDLLKAERWKDRYFSIARGSPAPRPAIGRDGNEKARHLAANGESTRIEESAPISIVGSGPNLNTATEVGLRRAAQLLSITVPEVMNRATITGGIEIGRLPGVVQITFRAPLSSLESAGLLPFVRSNMGLARGSGVRSQESGVRSQESEHPTGCNA